MKRGVELRAQAVGTTKNPRRPSQHRVRRRRGPVISGYKPIVTRFPKNCKEILRDVTKIAWCATFVTWLAMQSSAPELRLQQLATRCRTRVHNQPSAATRYDG